MGIKSTMTITQLEALHIIAEYVGAEWDANINKQIENILEKVTDFQNPNSAYYFDNFNVRKE